MMGDDGAEPLLAEMRGAARQLRLSSMAAARRENDIVAIRELRPQRRG